MTEPLMPVPPPEADGHHDPLPPRCSAEGCRNIVSVPHPVAPRGSREWDGWGHCTKHGTVRVIYGPNSGLSKEES